MRQFSHISQLFDRAGMSRVLSERMGQARARTLTIGAMLGALAHKAAESATDGVFLTAQQAARLAQRLPEVYVGLTDWHLSVAVGQRRRGFTVGPYFLSYDKDNDIARQLFFSEKQRDMDLRSDVSLEWSSHTGIIHLHIPHVHIHEGRVMPESGDDASEPSARPWPRRGTRGMTLRNPRRGTTAMMRPAAALRRKAIF